MPSRSALAEEFGTFECHRYRDGIFDAHYPVKNELLGGFLEAANQSGNAEGNQLLSLVDKRLRVGVAKQSAVIDDYSITDRAEQFAKVCKNKFEQVSKNADFESAVDVVRWYVEGEGVGWPFAARKKDTDEQKRNKQAGAIARVVDSVWWRRRLRRLYGAAVECVLRDLGAVRRGSTPYVSDWAFRRWVASQQRNAGVLETMVAVCDETEEQSPLIDCVEKSVSNPAIKRAELMTRIRGYEEVAVAMGLKGLFLTLTTPSAYHARRAESGVVNPKYKGYSPADGQEYLSNVWAKIRAAWHRAGIKPFGFRVCEPHHDGTPHAHFLLFFSANDTNKAWEIFREYALEESPNEHGAQKIRATRINICPSKGTASGYIAKYISKNIDGFGFGVGEQDEEGGIPTSDGALRVRAWASIWGIRQFQQIGSCSVTVWRELRRHREIPEEWVGVDVDELWEAADAGDWKAFVELMGGAFVSRDAQTLRALHVLADKLGKYGDEVSRIFGLALRGSCRDIRTRFKEWRIVRCDEMGVFQEEANGPPPLDLCQ